MRLAVVVALVACRDKEAPPAPASSERAVPTEAELRAQNTLALVERGGAFEVRDPAGSVTLVLPQKPALAGDLVTRGTAQAFRAEARLRGPLDVELGVLTMRDWVLPAEVLATLEAAPFEIAKDAGGGDIQRNMMGQLAGQPAHVFELVTPDQRRILGWYVPQTSRGRLIQIHCSGPESDATRVGCDEIAASLRVQQ